MSEPERKNMPAQRRRRPRACTTSAVSNSAPSTASEHDLALWEKRTDAMLILLRDNKRRVFTVDAHRRMIESYGRAGVRPHHLLREMDPLRAQPARRAGRPDARGDRGAHGRGAGQARKGRPQGSQGQRAVVRKRARRAPRTGATAAALRRATPVRVAARPALGHCRTPWYLRGKTGVVAAVQGRFRNPELLAYHKPGLAGAGALQGALQAGRSVGRYAGPPATISRPTSTSTGSSR